MRSRQAGQVHHGEEEIPHLGRQGVRIDCGQLPLHLRQLFLHFGECPSSLAPVEPHARHALLDAMGPEERVEALGEPIQRGAVGALARLDRFPRLTLAPEQMWMAPDHLRLEEADDLVTREALVLFRHDDLERDV